MVGPARIDEAGHDHGEDEFTTEFINFLVPRRFTTAQRAASVLGCDLTGRDGGRRAKTLALLLRIGSQSGALAGLEHHQALAVVPSDMSNLLKTSSFGLWL